MIPWSLVKDCGAELDALANDGALWLDRDSDAGRLGRLLHMLSYGLVTGTKTPEGSLWEPTLLGLSAALMLGVWSPEPDGYQPG